MSDEKIIDKVGEILHRAGFPVFGPIIKAQSEGLLSEENYERIIRGMSTKRIIKPAIGHSDHWGLTDEWDSIITKYGSISKYEKRERRKKLFRNVKVIGAIITFILTFLTRGFGLYNRWIGNKGQDDIRSQKINMKDTSYLTPSNKTTPTNSESHLTQPIDKNDTSKISSSNH